MTQEIQMFAMLVFGNADQALHVIFKAVWVFYIWQVMQ